jgi:hypothetical protein
MATRDVEILIGYVRDALDHMKTEKDKARLELEKCKTKECRNNKLIKIIEHHRNIRKMVMELKDDLDALV